jgi:hypothetical protein
MNKLLRLSFLLLVLASCSSPATSTGESALQEPKIDLTQEAVMAYLHKTLDDPSSYQSGRWGEATPRQQIDADTKQIFAETAAMAKHSQRLKDSLLHAYRYHELRTSGYPYLPS